MNKIVYLLSLILLSSCGVKNIKKFKPAPEKKQVTELALKEEKLKRLARIKEFYKEEIADINSVEKSKITQDNFFANLDNYVRRKYSTKEQSQFLPAIFNSKPKPYTTYREILDDNLGFLSQVKSYFYLKEKTIQDDIRYLLDKLTKLQEFLTITPELSYEKRR